MCCPRCAAIARRALLVGDLARTNVARKGQKEVEYCPQIFASCALRRGSIAGASRQNSRILSPKCGTPVGATKPTVCQTRVVATTSGRPHSHRGEVAPNNMQNSPSARRIRPAVGGGERTEGPLDQRQPAVSWHDADGGLFGGVGATGRRPCGGSRDGSQTTRRTARGPGRCYCGRRRDGPARGLARY